MIQARDLTEETMDLAKPDSKNKSEKISNLPMHLQDDVQRISSENRLSTEVKTKLQTLFTVYKDADSFMQTFSPEGVVHYLKNPDWKDDMIANPAYPSLTIAKYAFGGSVVQAVVMRHLYELKKNFGVTATDEQMQCIAEDIVDEYGFLKVSEIILFFKMFRSGKFRLNDTDRAKMYGGFSGEVIMDCLYQYKHDYRDVTLRRLEDEENKRKREEADMRAATPQEKFDIFAEKCLKEPEFLNTIRYFNWLSEEEILKIENMIKEYDALKLFYEVGKEFVEKVNAGCDPKTCMTRLENGVAYISKNFEKKDEQVPQQENKDK